jgi:oligopeptide/dipeptide ABC transporter ATP-binding protein
MTRAPLVSIRGIRKEFAQRQGILAQRGVVRALRDVSLDIAPGETLGVVGESGCGKSTLGRIAVGLLEPDAGDVLIAGQPLYDRKTHADYPAFRRGLAGRMQMIFQDPQSSLNPRMRVGESVAEPLRCSTAWLNGENASPGRIRERVRTILSQVGLGDDAAMRYPHEFSGGQRQRIAIARALATRPDFVVCDEPTSSLDASVQSQVLNLLRDMQRELGLTCCFISHDLSVVRHMSDRMAVLYRGLLVEEGDAESLFAAPRHPYTRLLLDSVADAAPPGATPQAGPASPEKSAENIDLAPAEKGIREKNSDFAGCPFAPRCPQALPQCRDSIPPLLDAPGFPGRRVRCRLFSGVVQHPA